MAAEKVKVGCSVECELSCEDTAGRAHLMPIGPVPIPDCSSDGSGLSTLDCIVIWTYQYKDNWFLQGGLQGGWGKGLWFRFILWYWRAGLCIYVMCEWGKAVAEEGNESLSSILPSVTDRNLQFILVRPICVKGTDASNSRTVLSTAWSANGRRRDSGFRIWYSGQDPGVPRSDINWGKES